MTQAGSKFAARYTVIAIDTNILVYAHRVESPFHKEARVLIESLADSPALWAVPWPCVYEFIAIVTSPRIFRTPTAVNDAFEVIRSLAGLPNNVMLGEGDGYLDLLQQIAVRAKTQGGTIHDARIAAICTYHGVSELWSADRDFSRFPGLNTRNPLTR